MQSRTKPTYRIAIVNNADWNNPEHWDKHVSVRKQRMIRRARKLRSAGNRNVILFGRSLDGSKTFPVSLRTFAEGAELDLGTPRSKLGHNTAWVTNGTETGRFSGSKSHMVEVER